MDHVDLLLIVQLRRDLADGTALRLREQLLLHRAEVAASAGIAATTLAHWERGERIPRGAAALKYAQLLSRLRQQVQTESAL